jgi:hypothetical protein
MRSIKHQYFQHGNLLNIGFQPRGLAPSASGHTGPHGGSGNDGSTHTRAVLSEIQAQAAAQVGTQQVLVPLIRARCEIVTLVSTRESQAEAFFVSVSASLEK